MHNPRLFKPEFRKIVSAGLNDIIVSEGTINDLDVIYEKMKQDFPSDERLKRDRIELLMANGNYQLLIAWHQLFDVIVGYAFVFEPEYPKIIWLDYMAVDIKFRNMGYGTLLFNKLSEHRSGDNLGVFLEIEIPEAENEKIREDQNRRIKFYERLGAKKLAAEYELPTNENSQKMYLFFRPSFGLHFLSKDQIQESITSAFEYIHGDKSHWDNVLKRFVQSIHDESF